MTVVETSVQLHQLAKVQFALPALAMFLAFPLPAPQPFRQHPTAQRLVIHSNAVFLGQVFGCQGRPKSFFLRTGIFLLD
jgi:hypothetical protein